MKQKQKQEKETQGTTGAQRKPMGGARPGAGRPRVGQHRISVRIPDEMWFDIEHSPLTTSEYVVRCWKFFREHWWN